MDYELILALDPSGAFYEGKGTTGWCVFNARDNIVTIIGDIKAQKYSEPESYWHRHLDLIESYHAKYKNRFCIVMEDYFLYEAKAKDQIHSRMETCQLIGIIKHYCWLHNIPYFLQSAGEVKKRWSDEILHHKHYICQKGRGYALPVSQEGIHRHCMDAIRHAVHFATFKNARRASC